MRKAILTMNLPKVGDKLMRIMSKYSCEYDDELIPKPCIVTYVNDKHGWYQVQFYDSGIKECYGLPTFDHSIIRINKNSSIGSTCIPVACVETGVVYSSIKDCARDMRLDSTCIVRQLNDEYGQVNGYHFVKVL